MNEKRIVAAPEIKTLRKSFREVVDFLDKYNLDAWIGRNLVVQAYRGTIEDDEKNHDIDFHLLADDKSK